VARFAAPALALSAADSYHAAMATYLDDQEIKLGMELGVVLDAARDRLSAAGRVVVEVQLEGKTLGSDALAGQRELNLAGSELRIYSADPRELAITTLVAVREQLAEGRTAQVEAADLFQQDQFGPAMKRLGQAMEIWNHTPEALTKSAMILNFSEQQIAPDGRTLAQLSSALVVSLRNLRDLIDAKDTVGLADALAFEWPQILDHWDHAAQELIHQAEEAPKKG
jgi:hypothetical protein